MKSSYSRARALTCPALVASLALLFTACGQSPGETGLGYLEAQGIRISAPLYHLTLEDLPLDSVFASEVPLNHFGESLLVVGREGDYITRARLGFQLTTKGQRDSLVNGLHLRLSAIQTSSPFAGRDYLRDAAGLRDSVRLLVESFSWVDSTGSYSDSITNFHRRILTSPVPFSTLEARFKKRDTITVYPKRAYPDSGVTLDTANSQAGLLPHLWNRLRNEAGSDTARKWTVYLEISPLTTADSGMFHFSLLNVGGNDQVRRGYLSGLWLGRYSKDSLATLGGLLAPYFSSGRPASNYDARFTGTSTRSLLHGISRGVHLRINRDTLLARIRVKLNAMDTTGTLGNRLLGTNPAGTFDRRFFVPYAEMRLPVDPATTRVPGAFAFDLGVTTDVDSLGDASSSFRDDIGIGVGDSIRLTVHGGTSGTSSAVDTLVVSYRPHPVDTALRQVLTRWVNATVADTISLTADGLHRELTLRRHTGWARATTLSVKPTAARLGVEVYFNVSAVTEPRFILDSLGNVITTKSRLTRGFYRPGADSVNIRVTRGLRNLLNRIPGTSIAPDMFLRTVDRDAFDTSLVSNLTYRRVVQPAFGEIDFKRAGDGKLKVGIDLYLYPLEAGQ
jgi:hypothetical protein